jgi:3-methyladenine DNA glycosylase AlkD
MSGIIGEIRSALEKACDEKTRKTGEGFFREKVRLYGVKTPVANKLGKEYYKAIKDKKKTEIFKLCGELWRSGYIEESIIACQWSYNVRKEYEPGDFKVFEKWVDRYVGNWASCDTLCNHTVGAFVEMYPGHIADLKRWALSKNRWMRRGSAVSLIIPAKQGKFLDDVFEIADTLLADPDDLVQKGYGWMLKAAATVHQKEVFDFVMKRKAAMPRTALRYAIEKMPGELKSRAMG